MTKITAPIVDSSMADSQAREKLQNVLGILAKIANELGSMTVLDMEQDRTAKTVWSILTNSARFGGDVRAMLKEFATDDIPF